MHVVDIGEHVGWFPQVELPYEEGSVDIRDYRVVAIDKGVDLDICLESGSGWIILKFVGAKIIEDNGSSTEAAIGTWLLSISRPEVFSIETGKDILAFSLDYAVVGSWIVQCREARAIIQLK